MAGLRSEQEWLALVRAAAVRGDLELAQGSLQQAMIELPGSVELLRTRAGLARQTGNDGEAEAGFRAILAGNPRDAASAFPLAQMLAAQARASAAASVLRACFVADSAPIDANLAIAAIELLDDVYRKREAAAIAGAALASNPDDSRLHAYAGMLEIQLGEFEIARQHYLFALEHDERAWEWHVPIGLSAAQRYGDTRHPDFARFSDGLQRPMLSEPARAELHFALGKAYDDTGDYAEAARHFRDGNAIRHRMTKWSRKAWRRAVEARLASKSNMQQLEPMAGFTPVFIVGMPRSGTTLLAELLSRYPKILNRGELPWIARLAERAALAGTWDRSGLQAAAATYTAHARQDDAHDARWVIDKQPLNFRYVDLALAMFPDARIVHCQRSPCDTALSLWMQCFLEDVQGYSYDFDDIALVMRDCERLMARWGRIHPDSVRTVHYEDLVAAPQPTVAALAAWMGLPAAVSATAADAPSSNHTIGTASLWQARQPVNTRSVGRWKHYADVVPELRLMRKFETTGQS